MIFGIGTDLVEIARVNEKLEKNTGFVDLVYSVNEIAYCNSKTKSAESYAARFAAKEAFLKALKTGMFATITLNQIEVLNDKFGAPYFILSKEVESIVEKKTGTSNFKTHLSISHTSMFATAVVVIEIL